MSKPRIRLALAFLLLTCPLTAMAQQQGGSAEEQAMMAAMMAAMTPGPAHAELASRAGQWKMTSTFWMDPSQPPMVTPGMATREAALGGRVLIEKVTATMMGMPFEGFGMTGYDNVTGKFWTTWNDNMSTGIVQGTGTRGSDGKTVYDATMNDPMTKKPLKIRMVITETADTEVMEWYETRDGKETKTMEVKLERVKK